MMNPLLTTKKSPWFNQGAGAELKDAAMEAGGGFPYFLLGMGSKVLSLYIWGI